MMDQTPTEPICSICGERVSPLQNVVVTAGGVLHVECVEQSAAAA
jgi:hypothetical protein